MGDRILAVDGRELRGRRFATCVRPQPKHTLAVLRFDRALYHREHQEGAAPQGGAAHHKRHGFFGLGRKHRALPGEGDPFAIDVSSAPTWFGPAAYSLHP